MPHPIHLAQGLTLPLDAVTQKFAWLGRTGSGKTYAAKRLIEQMLRANAHVIVLDPVGVWAGLRRGPKAFAIPVLGGLYGDVPLEPTGGALVAEFCAEKRTSAVLDVSQMLDSERTRFATAWAERFFQLQKATPQAVHVVLEECQDFVPQNPEPGEQMMLHQFQRFAKQGRGFGIGLSLISQRPQDISKKALNQSECVFAFQLTGPQERKALEFWLADKGLEEKLSTILPRLEVGCPHVWSPQWLKVSKVVKILPIDSLDTSQTPKVGAKAARTEKLKPIELDTLRASMNESIERAKANDPRELRKRIAELEKVDKRIPPPAAPKVIERPAVSEAMARRLETAVERLHKHGISAVEACRDVIAALPGKDSAPNLTPVPNIRPWKGAKPNEKLASTSSHSRPNVPNGLWLNPAKGTIKRVTNGEAKIGKGETAILTALVQHRHSGGCTRQQLTVLTGYKRSTRDAYLQRLGQAALIVGNGDRFLPSDEGVRLLGDVEPLPTGSALARHWYERLPKGEALVLDVALKAYPQSVPRDEVTEDTGFKRSTRDAYIQRLATRQLITITSDGVRASEMLMDF